MRGPSYMPVLWSAPRYSAARGNADYDQFCANERHGQLGNLGKRELDLRSNQPLP